MPSDFIMPAPYIKGAVRLHNVPDLAPLTQWKPLGDFSHNDFLYEWGAIFANLLMKRGLNYGIGGMYLEFENVASPGDPVSVPAFTRDPEEGVAYYNGLSTSDDRDYLRVPLISSQLTSTDAVQYPHGNRVTFFAQSSGVSGVHGKEFSDAVNSTLFGGALVAMVDDQDVTRDLVLSRFYVDVDKQQVKLLNSQLGFEWRITLG